jgi:hypothetical protein
LIRPFHRRGGEWLAVHVAGSGVERERDEAFAIGAIDLDFANVEKSAVTAPVPIDVDGGAADRGVDVRLEGQVIGAGLLRTFNAESRAGSFIVGGAAFDLLNEGAEADFTPGSTGGTAVGNTGAEVEYGAEPLHRANG